MSPQAGSRLGPYELTAPIGAGGMGEVWRGRDTRLDRAVAVKILPAGFAEDGERRVRFEREARTISSLSHPHICTLFDVGREGDTHYLVMELLEGESLADRLARGPLPLDQVVKIGAQVADALDAAHRQGIVHRDLKPGNVMLTKAGAKLLDFGLARSGAPAGLSSSTELPTEAKPLTAAGTMVGTFQYMAPEQLEGQEADPRTDIFALGALLYEMATARRAFEGRSKTSLIAAILTSQPPLISSVIRTMPPALDHVVRKCLEKDPDDRWQSAHDVANELRWIGEAGSQAGVPAMLSLRRRTRERLAWGLAVAFAAAAAIGYGWVLHLRRTATAGEPPLRAELVPPRTCSSSTSCWARLPSLQTASGWPRSSASSMRSSSQSAISPRARRSASRARPVRRSRSGRPTAGGSRSSPRGT
jgi:serine/threonine protein kinase